MTVSVWQDLNYYFTGSYVFPAVKWLFSQMVLWPTYLFQLPLGEAS